MKDITELDRLTMATRRREYEDGLVDFVYGILFLVLGLACWYIFSVNGMRWYLTAFIRNRDIALIGSLLAFGLFILVVAGSRRLVDKLRHHFWKNLGIVKPLRYQVRWQVQLIATVVAAGIILVGFWLALKGLINPESGMEVLITSVGISTGIVFLGMGAELKVGRYYWVGIAGILGSLIPIIFPLSISLSWLIFGVTWMVILAFSGCWTLYKFASTHERSIHE